MVIPLILASGSEIRAGLLRQAGISFEVCQARLDEDVIKRALIHEKAPPRDIADALAEGKARKVAQKYHDSFVLGCDQVLEFKGELLNKPENPEDAIQQIQSLRGERHSLLSAGVIYHQGRPVWRHVGVARLVMRQVSDRYLYDYVERNWDSIRHSVGGYKLEEEGVRLFHRVEGDYFHVLGMPLLEVLAFLSLRGVIDA